MNTDKENKNNNKQMKENISKTNIDESNILSSENDALKNDLKINNEDTKSAEEMQDELNTDPMTDSNLNILPEEKDNEDHTDQSLEELEVAKDKLLRSMAEIENVRKQSDRQRSDLIKYGSQSLARDLIGVLDNLERASSVEVKEENLAAIKEGIDLTSKELNHVLEKNGVIRIQPLGEVFDPNIHQAMFESTSNKYSAGEISEVIQDGFLLYDRLLRPALVGVVGDDTEDSSSKRSKDKNTKK